jgi:hypothetical protein
MSPTRKRPKTGSPDRQPPRKQAREAAVKVKAEVDDDGDFSPPRQIKEEPDLSPQRRSRAVDDDDLSPPRSSGLMSKTLSGKKAGLQGSIL